MTRTLTHGMADVPPHAAHVPRMLLERIARDPESVGRPHTFTIDAAVVAVDICGYVPMTDWAMRGVLRRERSVKRPHSLRASFSSSSSFDAFEGGDPDNADVDAADLPRDPGDEREGRRSSDASGSDLCLGVAGLTGEEARNVVTACFTKAIREIHERGGDVLKFAGDALFAAWTASDDVSLGTCVAHATRCASAIHATVSKVGDSNTDNSSSVRLKVCVGAGELHAFNVGGVGGKWEFMCAGEPLAQIAKLMPLATPGQTLVSERAHSIIQSQSTGAHLRTAPAATGGHRLVIDRPRTDSDGIEHDIEHDIEDMIPPTSTPEAIVRLHAPNDVECDEINGVASSRRGGYRRVRPPPRRGRSGGHQRTTGSARYGGAPSRSCASRVSTTNARTRFRGCKERRRRCNERCVAPRGLRVRCSWMRRAARSSPCSASRLVVDRIGVPRVRAMRHSRRWR